jgi:NADH:ubiquinone reductase (H+-translocating)
MAKNASISPDWPHVVIIGGGFAGLETARGLSNKQVRVTIVDRHNFHTFLPLLYQVATASLEPAEIAYPIRTIFGRSPNVHFRHGRVADVDTKRQMVVLTDGNEITYDHVVVATGATANFFGIPGAREHALPLYSLADSRHLRNVLLLALEKADARADYEPVEMNFVVVGGGPTGVETAGAISELVSISIRKDGLRLDPKKIHVKLVDLAPRLLMNFSEKAGVYAHKELTRMGVEIELGRSVDSVDATGLHFADGEHVDAAAVIWAAGVTASGTLAHDIQDQSGPGGRARVGEDLRLDGYENVWSVGDAAAVTSEGNVLPQLAPVAMQSGRHCAQQILSTLEGRPTEPFVYYDKGIMATIGRHSAVAQLPTGRMIRGTMGWFAWLGLHLIYLVGFRNRLRVLINWTWRYFDWPSGPRLIVADAETAD